MPNEPMSRHTTFRVGGEAGMLLQVSTPQQLKVMIPLLNEQKIPYFIKGNGSNLLVGDKGYDGIILEIGKEFGNIEVKGNLIVAGAGALMSSIAQEALKNSLTGFEFASGIPGTIGGGITMNAGAYDGELKDIVTKVEVINSDGEVISLSNEEMNFGYRTSIIKQKPLIVTSVTLSLNNGDSEKIKARMDELAAKRREKQPLEYPSAGSTFKRPEGYFAGKLIMDAGLRGYTVGGAQVSEKHCGFVINKGNATAEDVYELICDVQDKVKARFGVVLEPEVIFLGVF
ncbi:MAG: UDP-N-acetylmuramate dehydrogenase [Lachnospiraceae bacterium]|nr:UDP-N-acetylmuramate dehydrogenase [Lachnospiraceae bacterium]